jgi:phosphatidylglycerophosphatase A
MAASEQDTEQETGSPRLSFTTKLVATGFFTGYIPWASGTFGSLVGVLIYLVPGAESPVVLLAMIVAGFAAGVVTAGRVARVEGHHLSRSAAFAKATFQPGEHNTVDPSIVVIDEIVGMWISLLLLPKTPAVIFASFIAFRVMDIAKPEPARRLERVPNGWGIMLDDVVAGIYANLVIRVLSKGAQLMFPQLLQ